MMDEAHKRLRELNWIWFQSLTIWMDQLADFRAGLTNKNGLPETYYNKSVLFQLSELWGQKPKLAHPIQIATFRQEEQRLSSWYASNCLEDHAFLLDTIREGEGDAEERQTGLLKVVDFLACYRAITRALDQHVDMEDRFCAPVGVNVDEEYTYLEMTTLHGFRVRRRIGRAERTLFLDKEFQPTKAQKATLKSLGFTPGGGHWAL